MIRFAGYVFDLVSFISENNDVENSFHVLSNGRRRQGQHQDGRRDVRERSGENDRTQKEIQERDQRKSSDLTGGAVQLLYLRVGGDTPHHLTSGEQSK